MVNATRPEFTQRCSKDLKDWGSLPDFKEVYKLSPCPPPNLVLKAKKAGTLD
jgi:hypothetical protein